MFSKELRLINPANLSNYGIMLSHFYLVIYEVKYGRFGKRRGTSYLSLENHDIESSSVNLYLFSPYSRPIAYSVILIEFPEPLASK
jgi:hypothetical protein